MRPKPRAVSDRPGCGRLAGRVALVTGGDSGIGRAVAIAFAREGADLAVAYLEERRDARDTAARIEEEGRRCLLVEGDVGDPRFCRRAVERTLHAFGRLDVLVNNAAEQHPCKRPEDLAPRQLERTFRTNLFSCFHLVRAALPHLRRGAAIVNA